MFNEIKAWYTLILGNFAVIVDNSNVETVFHPLQSPSLLETWKYCLRVEGLIISVTNIRGIDRVRRSIQSTTGARYFSPVFPGDTFLAIYLYHGENSFWIVPRTSGTRTCHRPSCTFLIFRLAVLRQRVGGNFWDTAAMATWALHKLRDIISVTRWLLYLYFATLCPVPLY